jgi:Holliday junction resolvasome RuvABC endonuclease subunit
VAIKLDPGSKTTGIAVVVEVDNNVRVLSLMELQHRGKQISEAIKRVFSI